MKRLPISLIYLLILLEGYIVLASELLAIRQSAPFVGTGTDTVAIIIAAVLLPLAAGYHAGGQARPASGIRKRILRNMWISGLFLLLGLSVWTVTLFFGGLMAAGIYHRYILISLYAAIFLVTPVYLLGQTVPLLSNYFSKARLSQIAGRMLAISTAGSFLGATLTTLVLMSWIGINYTLTVLLATLLLMTWLLGKKTRRGPAFIMAAILAVSLLINSDASLRMFGIVHTNQYTTISITHPPDGSIHFLQNNTDSSAIYPDGKPHSYNELAESWTIHKTTKADPPREILVIGAGGFSFGRRDEHNRFTYVDIDPDLEAVATEHFLKGKLRSNQVFVPMAAQAFLLQPGKLYDLIFLDVFHGDHVPPEDLLTREFFQSLKERVKPGGLVMINLVISPTFIDPLSRNIENTLRDVFPHISRQLIGDFDAWSEDPGQLRNALYSYRKGDPADEATRPIYTHNLNRVFIDKPHRGQ